eukprot:1023978-Lingulodinium_polyedra.AAC.1
MSHCRSPRASLGRRPAAHCTSSTPASRASPRSARSQATANATRQGIGGECRGGRSRAHARSTACDQHK